MSRGTAKPRVAVIVPCKGDGEFVEETLRSVREDEPVEIVVVDDASTDIETAGALARLEGRGVKVVRHGENQGVSAARMTGLANTTAPYVFPLDSDDLAVEGMLAAMADRLDGEPVAAFAFGDYLEFGEGHLLLRAVPTQLDPFRIAYTNEYPPSALFRREIVVDSGGWRRLWEGLDARSDWGLWMSLAESGMVGLHMGPRAITYLRRMHSGRLAYAGRRHHREIYRALRERHQVLFANVDIYRRESSLPRLRKTLYPIVYGRRVMRPYVLEPLVKGVLDRWGLWTLQHRIERHGERPRLARVVRRARGLEGTPASRSDIRAAS